jgi:predicted nuclease of predicted toxin-antitoxin system
MKILADENVHRGIVEGTRQLGYEVLAVQDIGLTGFPDSKILEYAETNNLILLTGDKDFGGLIEFGTLWGRGKVILLRYHLINIDRITNHVGMVLDKEKETFQAEKSVIIVLSEAGYRIHKPETLEE